MSLHLGSRRALLAGGGFRGAWSPGSLGTALLGWWDAERDTSKITQSGGLVSSWADLVGSYAATQGVSASRPVWSATSFNGRPGITFDGSDDELTLASVPFPTGASACEIWALVDQQDVVADTTNRRIFAYGGNANATSRHLYRSVGLGMYRAGWIVGDGVGVQNSDNTPVDLSGRHVMRLRVSPTATQVDVDGVAGSSAAVVPGTGTTRTRLGANTGDAAGGFWKGHAAALLVTSTLSTDQASQLLTYLKARGGIA